MAAAAGNRKSYLEEESFNAHSSLDGQIVFETVGAAGVGLLLLLKNTSFISSKLVLERGGRRNIKVTM